MSAPAPNIMAASPPGASPGAVGAKTGAAAGGGLAGFEALLAALFPQGAPGGAAAAPGLAVAAAATGAGGKGANTAVAQAKDAAGKTVKAGEDDPGKKDASATPDDAGQADPGTADAAAAALTASLAAAPAAAAASTTTPPTTQAAPEAAPNATNGGTPFTLPGPAEATTPEAAPAEAAAAQGDAAAVDPDAKPAPKGAETPKSAGDPSPPAWGRDKPPGQPAAPALQHAHADLGAGKPPPPQPTAADNSAATVPPDATAGPSATLAALMQAPPVGERAPKTTPAHAARPESRTEKSDTELPPGMRPLEASDRPVHARTADAAAPPAGKDAIEAAAADDGHAKDADPSPAAADDAGPDPAPAGDGRSAAPPAAALAHASAPVRGSPETVAALAAQIVKKLDGRTTRFDLELDPAGLGKVDVRLEIGAQGRITAALTCDNHHAANELRARANELQRALEQAGFDLSGGLSFDVADNGRQQGQPWQDQAQDGGGGFRGQAFRAALDTAGEADVAASGPLRLRRGVTAGLDLRI